MSLTLHHPFKDNPTLAGAVGAALSITRATTGYTTDADGWLREYQSGEARFQGAAFTHNLHFQSNSPDTAPWNVATQATLTVDAVANPIDATVDAWQLTEDTATASRGISVDTFGSAFVRAGHTYVVSVYAKNASGSRYLQLRPFGLGSGYFYANFDLSDGSVAGSGGTQLVSATSSDEGNGWYRCYVVFTASADSPDAGIYYNMSNAVTELPSYLGDGTSGFYLYGAQIEDVSGAWDSYNSAPDSQTFSNARWAKASCTITSDSITDPDGGANGDLVTAASGASAFRLYDSGTGALEVGDYFFSGYLKAGTLDWVNIEISSIANTGNVYYDLSTGTKGTETDGAGRGIESSGIIDAGNGWYRCWIKVRVDGTDTVARFNFFGAEADGDRTFTSTAGTETFYVYGAQYEIAKPAQTVPGTYVETTGLTVQENYSPSTYIATTTAAVSSVSGSNDGLLVEEARTNICLQSEDLSTTWTNTRSVDNSNQTIAPDGSTTADQLIDDSSTGSNSSLIQQSMTVATSTTYCLSVFAKADQLGWMNFELNGMASQALNVYYDLINGAVGTVSADVVDSGIDDYGNGWYRCWFTWTSDSSDTSCLIRIFLADADNDRTVDLDGTSSIFVWGAQLEVGAFPLSYIPTTTGSVTRNSEEVLNSSLAGTEIPVDGYSAYFHWEPKGRAADIRYLVWTDDGGTSDRTYPFIDAADDANFYVTSSAGTNVVITPNNSIAANTAYRTAYAFQENDALQYLDGSQNGNPVTNNAVLGDPQTRIKLGGQPGNDSGLFCGLWKEVAFFDERLADADLSDLSDGTKTVADLAASFTFVRDLVRDLVSDIVRDTPI